MHKKNNVLFLCVNKGTYTEDYVYIPFKISINVPNTIYFSVWLLFLLFCFREQFLRIMSILKVISSFLWEAGIRWGLGEEGEGGESVCNCTSLQFWICRNYSYIY